MRLIISIIFSLCLISVHSQYCSGSYALQYSGKQCIFDYDYSDPNCTQFNFIECNWIECVEWVQQEGDKVCSRTKIFWDYSWNYCTRTCCDYNVVYPYDYSSLDQCQEYLKDQYKISLIIIFSVFGGILLIFLIFGICNGCIGFIAGSISGLKDCFGSCFETICQCPCFRRRQHGVNELQDNKIHNSLIAQPNILNKSSDTPQTPTPS